MGAECARDAPTNVLGACFHFLWSSLLPKLEPEASLVKEPVVQLICSTCGSSVAELARGVSGDLCCRACIRCEDEALLAPFTPDERRGLDTVATVLDKASFKFWKPGEQPAQILDWLFLGDVGEATDFALLAKRGIGAVLNLMNWWELSGKFPEVEDFDAHYGSQGVDFLMVDSEDRLFFNIVEDSWPQAKTFLQSCRAAGQRVLVNCAAGHNRSACMCVCWLVIEENMSLVEALDRVQSKRGSILSNCGFRLQLVRLALSLERIGISQTDKPFEETFAGVNPESGPRDLTDLTHIITRKRSHAKYDYNSQVFSCGATYARKSGIKMLHLTPVAEEGADNLSQRTLKMDLLACLYHQGKVFASDYEYTSDPPTVVGKGWSGEVVLCKRRERSLVKQNEETSVRCVKRFVLEEMNDVKLDKLKNEATIYLSLEHPHIARLFDVFENQHEVSFVMQYCSGGTLEDALRKRGAYRETEFQDIAVPMLLALNYIHLAGIVHRDIKPRNWVFEADGATIKLIDFGFSVKACFGQDGKDGQLQDCLGTLGYMAPEVLSAACDNSSSYTFKCDIWSLGVVFHELLTGQPAFHKEIGVCDGYTKEVVMREIQEITPNDLEVLLADIPVGAGYFIRPLLAKDPSMRPCAREALNDKYLTCSRNKLLWPSRALSPATVLERFRAHAGASKTSRAWLLACARSPTVLPWTDFTALRDTFLMFDIRGLTGTVDLNTFLAVVGSEAGFGIDEDENLDDDEDNYWERSNCSSTSEDFEHTDLTGSFSECQGEAPKRPSMWVRKAIFEEEVRSVWNAVCGGQESLSYCEFLAVLLPLIDDAFEDVPASSPSALTPRCVSPEPDFVWDPAQAVSVYLPLLKAREKQAPTFDEKMSVLEVVRAMSDGHHRWVIVAYNNGERAFFDFMDINRHFLKMNRMQKMSTFSCDGFLTRTLAGRTMEAVSNMPVGLVANCTGRAAFVPMPAETPLGEIIKLTTQINNSGDGTSSLRRIPIVDSSGTVLHVFGCSDVLQLAARFSGPTSVLKSTAARVFDRRNKMMGMSVMHDEAIVNALRVMDTEQFTTCPATSRELSGDMGGIVAISVISVTDLKLVFDLGRFDILDKSVDEFISWRTSLKSVELGQRLRQERLGRFNVVSVRAGDSFYMLSQRLLASQLPRIFLASEEIARIVGTVSARDILIEVLDQIT